MKRVGVAGGFSVLILGLLFIVVASWWRQNTGSVSTQEAFQRFVIPKGTSATQVGNSLFEKKLIRSALAFKIYVQFIGKQGKLNAGEFKLSPSMTLAEVVMALQGGPLELWVTIPEGLRREQIVERFIEGLGKESGDADIFREEFLMLTKGKEGYLFPDTYLFAPEASASAVVNKQVDTFSMKLDERLRKGIKDSGYNEKQIVAMASIIERETKTKEERPVVAGILWKRFEASGWLLQADATLQYAVGSAKCKVQSVKCKDWWPILTREDLEIDSPYNSYKVKALPPAPIASPGLSSIEAAIFPEESPYWFYIHAPDGQIFYAQNLSEHNANIRRHLGK